MAICLSVGVGDGCAGQVSSEKEFFMILEILQCVSFLGIREENSVLKVFNSERIDFLLVRPLVVVAKKDQHFLDVQFFCWCAICLGPPKS